MWHIQLFVLHQEENRAYAQKYLLVFLFELSWEQRNNKAPNLGNTVTMMRFMILASIVAISSANLIEQLQSPSKNLQGYS